MGCMAKNTITLFCNCSNKEMISREIKDQILTKIYNCKTELFAISDFCGDSVNNEQIKTLNNYDAINVIACYPRSIKWLLNRAGIKDKELNVFNMKTQPIDDFNNFFKPIEKSDGNTDIPVFPKATDWIPWNPVIDYDRCINCRQCASFCLFGVYQVNEKNRVEVVNPVNCKNNCPACGRICPEAAIIFPKVDETPINGDEITDEEAVKANIKNNVNEMLGDDVYAALAKRKKKAKILKLRKQAEAERHKYLNQENAE